MKTVLEIHRRERIEHNSFFFKRAPDFLEDFAVISGGETEPLWRRVGSWGSFDSECSVEEREAGADSSKPFQPQVKSEVKVYVRDTTSDMMLTLSLYLCICVCVYIYIYKKI